MGVRPLRILGQAQVLEMEKGPAVLEKPTSPSRLTVAPIEVRVGEGEGPQQAHRVSRQDHTVHSIRDAVLRDWHN